MSQYVEGPTRAFVAGAGIAQHLRVIETAGKLAVAGVGDNETGTLVNKTFADGDVVAVRLRNAQGTVRMVANAAILRGDPVFTAAAGKVGPWSAGAAHIGVALEAAAANNDLIEVLRVGLSNPANRLFTAGAAIAQDLRVKLSSGKLAAAGIADKELGTLEVASAADLDIRPVRLTSAPGTTRMIANAALAVGAAVFTAAAGKVGATASTAFYLGQALTSSAADGDVIEVLRNSHGDTAVT